MVLLKDNIHKRQKAIAKIIRPYLTGRVLDVGCGDTLVAKYTGHRDIIGIDIKKPKVEFIPFGIFDGEKIPFGDKTFDTVISTFVIHHAKHPSILLSELVRVGKRLIILEDKYDNPKDVLSIQTLHVKLLLKFSMGYNIFGFRSKKNWISSFNNMGLDIKKVRECSKVYSWPGLKHYLFILESP